MAQLDEAYILSSYTVDGKGESSDGWARVGVMPLLDVPEARVVAVPQKQKQASSSSSSSSSKRSAPTRISRSVAVNTVQRNGVHLVDLVEQSPLAAFTVSPSTTFTASAVSVSYPSVRKTSLAVGEASTSSAESSSSSRRMRKTFASVHNDQEGTAEVWCWTEQESEDGSSSAQPVKSSFSLQAQAITLSLLAVPEHLLVTLSDGQILLLDFDLQEVTRTTLGTSCLVRQQTMSAIPPHKLASLGFSLPPGDTTIVLPLLSFSAKTDDAAQAPKAGSKKSKRKSLGTETGAGTSGTARLAKVDVHYLTFSLAARRLAVAAACQLSHSQDVVDAAFLEGDGTSLIVLSALGKLATHVIAGQPGFRLQDIGTDSLGGSAPSPTPLSSAIAKSIDLSPDVLSITNSSITALSTARADAQSNASPYYLLTTRETASFDTLRFLLCDASFGLILAEQSVNLPSASTALPNRASRPPVIQLNGANVAFSIQAHVDGQPERETFYIMPCTRPERSTLADMMGKQALTQRYLVPSSRRQDFAPEIQGLSATTHQKDAATAQAQKDLLARVGSLLSTTDASKRDTKQADEAVKAWIASTTPATTVPTAFTQLLLELAVVPALPDAPVATGTVAALFSRSLISDSASRALPSGLVSSLLTRDKVEWPLILSALRKFRDIPEDSLVAALRASASEEDAELLPRVLRAVVRCPVTQAELRKSLKAGLGVQEVERILEICEDWLADAQKPSAVEDGDDEMGDNTRGESSPGVVYVVPFLQTVFDAHLVSLLQTSSLHPLIQSLSQHLASELQLSSSVLSLQGPLAEIHKIHQAQVVEEKERRTRQAVVQAARERQRAMLEKAPEAKKFAGRRQKDKMLDSADQRWKAKQRAQEAGLSVGKYALEEFKL